MRVVFMGTPSFAVPSLTALSANHEVVAVYSRPDAVSGRGGAARPSPVSEAAVELGLQVRTPATLRDPAEHDALTRLAPDIGVVAAYGLILPPEVLSVPLRGFVNVHASLLPRWRGAAPVQRAILAGDPVTGVSIMRMEEGLDTGPYCEIVDTYIGDKNAAELTEELAHLGADAVLRALDRIACGTCEWTAQDDQKATYAAKLAKDDVRLLPDIAADEFLRRTRASSRQAPARVAVEGSALTVLRAVSSDVAVPAATARRIGPAIVLGTAEGSVELLTVKPEGRKEMTAAAWLCGTHVAGDVGWTSAS